MTFLFWISTALTVIYGFLTLVSGAFQFKARKIPRWSALVLIILGGVILTSTLFILNNPKVIIIIILCFLLMHTIAIVNGIHLHGKINIKHHIIRFSFSIVIIILFII